MPVYGRVKWYWKKQPLAELDQDPPVIDTEYTILDTTRLTKLLYISTKYKDDDAVAKECVVTATINGTAIPGTRSPGDDTWNYWYFRHDVPNLFNSSSIFNANYWKAKHATSIKVTVMRQTDAIGANAELDGRVQYATWEPT